MKQATIFNFDYETIGHGSLKRRVPRIKPITKQTPRFITAGANQNSRYNLLNNKYRDALLASNRVALSDIDRIMLSSSNRQIDITGYNEGALDALTKTLGMDPQQIDEIRQNINPLIDKEMMTNIVHLYKAELDVIDPNDIDKQNDIRTNFKKISGIILNPNEISPNIMGPLLEKLSETRRNELVDLLIDIKNKRDKQVYDEEQQIPERKQEHGALHERYTNASEVNYIDMRDIIPNFGMIYDPIIKLRSDFPKELKTIEADYFKEIQQRVYDIAYYSRSGEYEQNRMNLKDEIGAKTKDILDAYNKFKAMPKKLSRDEISKRLVSSMKEIEAPIKAVIKRASTLPLERTTNPLSQSMFIETPVREPIETSQKKQSNRIATDILNEIIELSMKKIDESKRESQSIGQTEKIVFKTDTKELEQIKTQTAYDKDLDILDFELNDLSKTGKLRDRTIYWIKHNNKIYYDESQIKLIKQIYPSESNPSRAYKDYKGEKDSAHISDTIKYSTLFRKWKNIPSDYIHTKQRTKK